MSVDQSLNQVVALSMNLRIRSPRLTTLSEICGMTMEKKVVMRSRKIR